MGERGVLFGRNPVVAAGGGGRMRWGRGLGHATGGCTKWRKRRGDAGMRSRVNTLNGLRMCSVSFSGPGRELNFFSRP